MVRVRLVARENGRKVHPLRLPWLKLARHLAHPSALSSQDVDVLSRHLGCCSLVWLCSVLQYHGLMLYLLLYASFHSLSASLTGPCWFVSCIYFRSFGSSRRGMIFSDRRIFQLVIRRPGLLVTSVWHVQVPWRYMYPAKHLRRKKSNAQSSLIRRGIRFCASSISRNLAVTCLLSQISLDVRHGQEQAGRVQQPALRRLAVITLQFECIQTVLMSASCDLPCPARGSSRSGCDSGRMAGSLLQL